MKNEIEFTELQLIEELKIRVEDELQNALISTEEQRIHTQNILDTCNKHLDLQKNEKC